MINAQVYALLLVGGNDECFWPLSRKSIPKQLVKLFSDETLLENSLNRLTGLLPLENILILTNSGQEETIRKAVPDFPSRNIIAEPAERDTAPSIALGAAWVALRNHSATMIVLPTDHFINDRQAFQGTLQAAINAAQKTGDLITIGVEPSCPCPEYGYIELGEQVQTIKDISIHKVVRFREKPNPALAETFIKAGNFRWNTGMFVWQVPSILSAFERYAPELAAFIERVHESRDLEKAVQNQYSHLPKISIDYAVMEQAPRVLEIEAKFYWDDISGWSAVSNHLAEQDSGNRGNCQISALNAANNIAFSGSKKHVALLGVSDLILIETEDAILICPKHQTEKIKHLLAQIPRELQ